MIELGAIVVANSDTERCRDGFLFLFSTRRWGCSFVGCFFFFTLVTQGAVLGAPVASLQA